jgi:hypothetical protein
MQIDHLVESYLASAGSSPHTPWTALAFEPRTADRRDERVWSLELAAKGEEGAFALTGSLRLRFDLDVLSASLVVYEPSNFDAALAAGELVSLLNARRPLGCWYLDDGGRVCMRHAVHFGTVEPSEALVHDLLVATTMEAVLWRNAFHLVSVEQMPPDRAIAMMDRL